MGESAAGANRLIWYPLIIKEVTRAVILGCLESVEWNGGMEHWNGILEWPKLCIKLP